MNDIKTGDTRYWPAIYLQLAAYEHLASFSAGGLSTAAADGPGRRDASHSPGSPADPPTP